VSAEPYFDDGTVTLYLGDCREIVPELGIAADMILADPPYGKTRMAWDRWPDGWLDTAAAASSTLWCFSSMSVLFDHFGEFAAAGWRYDHEVVWEKHNGSDMRNDRFRRVHEFAVLWCRGKAGDQHRQVPRVTTDAPMTIRHKRRPPHFGDADRPAYASVDGGSRLMRSVVKARSMHGRAIHPFEKPLEIISPLIEYSCPPGGLVLDLFAGSGSTLDAARQAGRRGIGIEGDERYIEAATRRLSQPALETP
jgi:site-specific DNA-methyltransferase (adenine-specific)